jgi:hypothetical protein
MMTFVLALMALLLCCLVLAIPPAKAWLLYFTSWAIRMGILLVLLLVIGAVGLWLVTSWAEAVPPILKGAGLGLTLYYAWPHRPQPQSSDVIDGELVNEQENGL